MNPQPYPKRTAVQRSRPASLRSQRGLTLIEWMVAITIGMVIVAALTVLIAQQSATQAEFEKSSRQIENGRYAMQILNDDVQMAGYYGEFSNLGSLTLPTSMPDPCSTVAGTIEGAMAFAVQGYDYETSASSVTSPLSCIASANLKPGTDILVIRRAEPDVVTIAAAASAAGGQLYLQTGLTSSGLEFTKVMDTGANTGNFVLYNKDRATLSSLRKFHVHIYFISPCSVPASGSSCSAAADGGKPIPTLKMVELSASGNSTVMTTTPLVEGIEHMQIDYGFDANATGDGAPDGTFVSAGTATDTAAANYWGNLMAVRVTLLARNNESSPGYLDNKTYALGYRSGASAQSLTISSSSTDSYSNNVQPYKRRLFSQVIRLVNPSGRRDK